MTKEEFIKGITILEETFNRQCNRLIAWKVLQKEDGAKFLGAVEIMCSELRTMYPNDNLIAISKEYIDEFGKRKYLALQSQKEQQQIEYEPCPPPAEWEAMKKKLGI